MKFEIFFLTALIFFSNINCDNIYIDDSIHYFKDLETLKKIVINRNFMQCFFLNQSKYVLNPNCDENNFNSSEKNYEIILGKIVNDLLYTEKACFYPKKGNNYEICKKSCEDELKDYLPFMKNSNFEKKNFTIITNMFSSYFI